MRPLTLAKRVSSLPRPTFSPGFTRVPRCRTMIVPPGTTCPPNALNPNRCELESRPFRELPNPFLCAINQLQVLVLSWLTQHADILSVLRSQATLRSLCLGIAECTVDRSLFLLFRRRL